MALSLGEYEKFMGFRKDKFSDFLPYEGFNEDKEFFVSLDETDPYIGIIYECIPFGVAGEDQYKAILQILESPFPEDSFIQIILCADPRLNKYLDFFVNLRTGRTDKRIGELLLEEGIIEREHLIEALKEQKKTGKRLGEILVQNGFVDIFTIKRILKRQKPISTEWATRYADFIKSHAERGFYPDVPVPVRDFRLFVATKIKIHPEDDPVEIYEKLKHIFDDIESALVSSYFYPRRLNPPDLIEALYWWFNPGTDHEIPKYDEYLPIKQQLISPSTYYRWKPGFKRCNFYINDYAISVLNTYRFPKTLVPSDVLALIGDYLNQNLKQILCPFILTLNVYTKSANTKAILWAEKMFSQNIGGTGGYRLESKKEEAAKVIKLIDEKKEKFLNFSYSIILYSRPEYQERDVGNVKAIWRRQGFHLIDESVYPIGPFIFSLPLGPKINKRTSRYIEDRFRIAPASSIKDLAPIQAEWKGTGKPVMLFISRRGQLVTFDFFTGSETNFNAIIYAQSRAGKSFLTNYITTCYHGIGAQIWIIDIGKSYEKLCRYLGGEFVSLSRKKNICMNPFSYTRVGEDIESSLELISFLVARMAKPETGCDQEELNFIKEAVRAAWDKYEQDATITNVADFLSRRGKEKAHRLADLLSDYTHGGAYASLFDGPANVDLSGRKLMVLELEEFSKTPALRSVILALVLYHIQEACYLGDRSIPKLILIDEAWQFFDEDDKMIAKFIEHGFRRIAKYMGSFVVITQGMDDFYLKNKTIGQAIISSSAHHFILKQDPTLIDKLIAEKKLNVPETFAEYLKSIHVVKGKYSEFIPRTEGRFGCVSRLFVDDFSFALFNTDAEKVAFIKEKLDQGMDLLEAIEEAIRTNYGGRAIDSVKRAESNQMKLQRELIEVIKECDPRLLPQIKDILLTNISVLEEVANR